MTAATTALLGADGDNNNVDNDGGNGNGGRIYINLWADGGCMMHHHFFVWRNSWREGGRKWANNALAVGRSDNR